MDKQDFIIEYMKSGEKSCEQPSIGFDLGHLVLNDKAEAVSYNDCGGTEYIFDYLIKEKGFSIDDSNIFYPPSLYREDIGVSSGPGGQIIFHTRDKYEVKDIESVLLEFYGVILEGLEETGNHIYTLPFQPVSDVRDINILPKESCKFMFDYLSSRGKMSPLMMKGTATMNVNLDYYSERDYSRKYGMATRLTNIFYAIFDNVAFVKGRISPTYAYRALIAENTEPMRTGVIKKAFRSDFSYENYAEAVSKLGAVFKVQDGKIYSTDETVLDCMGEIYSYDNLNDLMSRAMYDIKTTAYIKLRMFDSIPYPYNMGVLALVKNIFYNEDNLDRMWNLFGDMSYKEHLRSRKEIYEKGIKAKIMGKKISRLGEEILAAIDIDDEDKRYLKTIYDLMSGATLRNVQVSSYKNYAMVDSAISANEIKKL